MPMNLYGPGDNFHLTDSHVLPAMIRKFHDAKINNLDTVVLWGTGNAKREFLDVDDVCDALIFLMNNYDDHHHINIGTGEEIRIYDLAQIVREITNFKGAIMWDSNYPDGVPQRKFDLTRIHSLGWYAKTSLIRGIESTYEWFVKNYDIARK
jgi:GDP-L-fucose synthase